MAAIFNTSCQKCGAKTVEVFMTRVLHWKGSDIPLMHPGESWQLEKFGLTMEKAEEAGILHLSTAYACRACGEVSHVKSLSFPSEPTIVSFLVLIGLVGAFAVFVSRNLWLCALVGVIGFIPAMYIDLYVSRTRVLRKHGSPIDKSCRHCGSFDTLELSDFLRDKNARLRCHTCGERERVRKESWIS